MVVDFGVVGCKVAVEAGDLSEGVLGRDRFSQAPRRWMGVVGVGIEGVGGVGGFESRGPLNVRGGGVSVSLVGCCVNLVGGRGAGGSGFATSGAEKADPISDKVSDRTCTRSEGAMAGTCDEGDKGSRLMRYGDWLRERYASARRSSTIVLSSLIASSTSVFALRILPARVGAVLDRAREGEGRRESIRGGDSVPRRYRSMGVLLRTDPARLVAVLRNDSA